MTTECRKRQQAPLHLREEWVIRYGDGQNGYPDWIEDLWELECRCDDCEAERVLNELG